MEKEPGTEEYQESLRPLPSDEPAPVAERPESSPQTAEPAPEPAAAPRIREADGRASDAENGPARRELLAFYGFGRRPEGAEPAEQALTPVLLHHYSDLATIRYDYPICITGDERVLVPLREIVDGIVDRADLEGDAAEVFRRRMFKLEARMKNAIEEGSAGDLVDVWDKAAEHLQETAAPSRQGKPALRDHMIIARRLLETDGALLSCDKRVPRELLAAAVATEWKARCRDWLQELDSLIGRLEDIVASDFSHSPDATRAEHLEASSGVTGDDLDFEEMSSLLGGSRLGQPMPAARRDRVRSALDTLKRVRPIYTMNEDVEMAFDTSIVMDDCEEPERRWQDRVASMVEFFKAIHIGKLEIENQYRESVHDDFFESVGPDHLTADERAFIPPVIVVLTGEFLQRTEAGRVMTLLGSTAPHKVLIEVDHLESPNGSTPEPSWPARAASMALGLGDAYVLQASVANPSRLRTGFLDGLAHAGPALFSVYTGPGGLAGEEAYLGAAAVVDSRAFPCIVFDPGRGAKWADRIDISDNPQCDRDWPVETVDYETLSGETAEMSVAFTAADFFYSAGRWPDKFWAVPPERWREDMVPVGELDGLGVDESEGPIPYLTVVDADGVLQRVVPTRGLLAVVQRCRANWRQLQDIGGVHNSFAERALDARRAELEAEKEKEVEAIEQRYQNELDRNIGQLTSEIVHRIAGRLLADGAAGPPLTGASPSPPGTVAPGAGVPADATPAEADAPVEAPEEEEEEDAIVFDDPYIDTPLCTTCNECTNMNGKMFVYNENKQAYIKDATAGTYQELVIAAEKCPVHIIHPGKPKNPDEPDLDALVERAARFNR